MFYRDVKLFDFKGIQYVSYCYPFWLQVLTGSNRRRVVTLGEFLK